jgi:hypothetical protein
LVWEEAFVYFAQLGCDRLPEIWAVSFTRLVGTSSKDRTRLFPTRRVKITVREFGAHEGSSPDTITSATPPFAGTVQRLKLPIWEVKMMVLPSGDQSGSLGFETPSVRRRAICEPSGEMV